jgi:hypothetical protein
MQAARSLGRARALLHMAARAGMGGGRVRGTQRNERTFLIDMIG